MSHPTDDVCQSGRPEITPGPRQLSAGSTAPVAPRFLNWLAGYALEVMAAVVGLVTAQLLHSAWLLLLSLLAIVAVLVAEVERCISNRRARRAALAYSSTAAAADEDQAVDELGGEDEDDAGGERAVSERTRDA